ncbi:hypothetical protein V8K88_000081 [Listeria monocytogenes]|uniref:tail assembly chaperone n=1 Tax=Listeria monocytogenes TaxID=1639 RepID=UPI0009870252|nr:tail assembly chaperone [Listeria monocytogenes]EAD4381120.1 hypothetical protein [Listeria monocytogenes]EAD4384184.1 hypothetical protein [Listeria monocytogenes]EAD4387238.1 hypothetical protein [Listeria monocytogenes]EAE4958928.1 hypothetical protein [Listeria monocytogenes]EAE5878544.1 hypothetical protein [Listeria monocytogenes]
MELTINEKAVKLILGIKQLRVLDKTFGLEVKGVKFAFGSGVSQVIQGAQNENPVVLFDFIKSTSNVVLGDIELENWLFEQDIEALSKKVLDFLATSKATKTAYKKAQDEQSDNE